MFKRLVAGAFVSVLTIVGVAPAATAGPSQQVKSVKVVKVVDAPKPIVPTFELQKRIDWD